LIWERRGGVGNIFGADIQGVDLFDEETVVVQVLDTVEGEVTNFKLYFPVEYLWGPNWRKDYDKKRISIA
jgi:hypothetical protein